MNIAHLNQWLSNREVKAIYWTLIHSLWEGLLIAALTGLVIASTHKASATVRYRLFCVLLVLFMVLMGCTFIYELGWTAPVAPVNQTLNITAFGNIPHEPVLVSGMQSLLQVVSAFLNRQAVGIFAIWLVCFLYKSFRLVGGIFYIYRIRTQSTVTTTKEITDKVNTFAHRIGIRKPVAILHSELVKVPATLGYLKPLIILPVGILFQLSTDQVETILWHELAHIRRRDYLVNILQCSVEAVFFFNPAILWLSALIREEREVCCDDIVLANVQQKGSYMEALMAFHGQYASVGGLAMALSLRPNQLMNRLRRMVYQENKKLSLLEMAILFIGMILFCAFTFIPQAKPVLKNSVAFIKKTITYQFAESQPQKLANRVNRPVKIKAVLSDSVEIAAKPVVIASDSTIIFKSIRFNQSNGDKSNREMNVIDGQNNHYHILIVNGQTTKMEINNKTVAADGLGNYAGLINQIDAVLAGKWRGEATISGSVPNPTKKSKNSSSQNDIPVLYKKDINTKRHSDTVLAGIKPTLQKKPKAPIDISAEQARARGVIEELIKAKIVSNASEVESFGLSDTELIVNGQTQPNALQQKLKESYGIKPNYGLYYGPVKTGGQGIVLDKKDL
jgi:bla regulator protein BlaR1